jgi:hypothetical protein
MTDDDIDTILPYLYEEYSNVLSGKAIVMTLKYVLKLSKHRYVVLTDNGELVGYYAYAQRTPSTVELSSVFVIPKWRTSKYLLELAVHVSEELVKYPLVKCIAAYSNQIMPSQYYNKHRKIFDVKKLFKKVH